jgi:SAM-dependent methyltransferase
VRALAARYTVSLAMSERVSGAIELAGSGGGRLALDVSAGDGLSTLMLIERGWRVIPTELKPRRAGWVGADLDSGLPFRPHTFDLVMMLEVIEHVADIPAALAEIARVVKPGGLAIISTPNRLNAASRVHYLFTGFYKGRRAPISYRYRVDDGRNWHVMGLNDFHWMAHGAGLRMDALGRSRRKLKSKLLAALLYLPVAVSSYMLYVRGVADPEQRRLNRELFRFMTSASCLMDENIVMRFRSVASRPDASGA